MNKNSKKTKGFPKKLLALMLCCFCLLATMPISAAALEMGESQITEESVLEQQSENAGESLLSVSSDIAESFDDTDDQQDISDDIVEPVTENEADTEVGTEVEDVTDMENETGTETESETDVETGAVTETETITDTETATEAETETGIVTDTESGAETEAAMVTDMETETEAAIETESETDAVGETEVESELGSETNAAGEAESETGTETDATGEAESEIGTETDAGNEAKTESETETDAVGETETETETVTDTESETETETGTVTDAESETETETGTVTDTESETETETGTETDATGTESSAVASVENESEIKTELTETLPQETEATVATEPSYLDQLNDYYKQAVAVGPGADNSVYSEIYSGAMAVYTAAGSPSAEDAPDVYNAVGMIVMTLQGYGYDPYAISTLAEERNIKYYRGDVDVYWDETNGTTTASESHITSLKLNDLDVLKADSSKGSGWSGSPLQVKDYYTSASTGNDQSVKLSITPAEGYYVTRITVACCPATVNPYKCATWTSGLAYDNELSINAGGTITIDLSVVAFCHDNNNKEDEHQYFILVQTAPLPSPLYVEYDYGEIVGILNNANLATTPFDVPDTWTSVGSSSDYYGSFTETDTLKFKQTENTQYMYRYAEGDEDDAAEWTHTSNYVTEAAKLAAASAGYYFSHWEAQYYEECVATAITDPTYNNYTYSFSDDYGNPVVYSEGVDVSMVTNVRLVAKWKPIELKVTKTVTGLAGSDFANEIHTYTIQVQKLNATSGEWENYSDALTFSITGDGNQTQTLSPITPGTYRAVETGGNENLSNSTTIMYITVSDGGQVTYDTANIQTSQEITVTNSYSSQPATYDLAVQKTVSGNMYDANKEFAFTVTYGEVTYTFNLKKDATHIVGDIPVGTNITVSEVPDAYTYSFVSITDGVTKTDVENGISFTMPAKDVTVVINNEKNVTVDTGILLDTLPYILILGVVAFGAILLTEKRRDRDDD